jgi:hypothetical protein
VGKKAGQVWLIDITIADLENYYYVTTCCSHSLKFACLRDFEFGLPLAWSLLVVSNRKSNSNCIWKRRMGLPDTTKDKSSCKTNFK